MLGHLFRYLILCLLSFAGTGLIATADTARIGVLAYRGDAEVPKRWQGLKRYLDQSIDGWDFELVPVTLSSADDMVGGGELDFLITNPGHFIDLNQSQVMSVIASRKQRKSDGQYAREFGSAIITRPDSGITHLQQVAGHSVAAVDRNAFGGFKIAWREFDNVGLDLFEDTSELRFVGFPMDQILWQVVEGKVDVGIIRSGMVEEFVNKGLIGEDDLLFLNSSANYTHPDRTSTRLYPEWPFAACSAAPAELRDKVALALLSSSDSPVARASGMVDIWTAPLPYHAVEVLSRDYETYTQNRLASPMQQPGRLVLLVFTGASLLAFVVWYLTRRKSASERPESPAPENISEAEQGPEIPVTPREKEILEFISSGYSTKEIARELKISPKTVEFHRANLLKKFGARTSSQLVAMTT